MASRFSPGRPVYLLAHALVFVVGMMLVIASQLEQLKGWPSTAVLSIGASLIAAGITGWVIYVYIRASDRVNAALEMFTEFGLVAAFAGRSVKIREQYDDRMRHFSKAADILGFGLNSLRQDNLKSFPAWKQQGRIRILLIDPEYPSRTGSYANQRDLEEQQPAGTIAREVRQFVSDTGPLLEAGRFEVRLYRCLPTINMYRIDDEILWGPYFVKEPSRNTPTFLIRSGGKLFARFTGHFDAIWNDPTLSREPPPEWHVALRPPTGGEVGSAM